MVGVGAGLLISSVSGMVWPERKRVVKSNTSSPHHSADSYVVEVMVVGGASSGVTFLSQLAIVACVFSIGIYHR